MVEKLKKLMKGHWKSALYLILGNLGYALTVDLFLAGNGIAAGGFSGIAIIINYVTYVPVGLFTLALSIPLFVWAYLVRGWRFVIMSVISTAVCSLFTDALAFLPNLTDNMLIASAAGGILYGVSAVLLVRSGSSGGGTDLLARMLLTVRREISLGTMYIICDGSVIVASMIVSGNVEMGVYAIVCIAVCSFTTDYIIRGFNRANVFYIITGEDPKPIADEIMYDMVRGVTAIPGKGMYAGSDKSVLMVVVKPREVYKLKDIVRKHDPHAFVVVAPASEIMGEGFSGIDASAK